MINSQTMSVHNESKRESISSQSQIRSASKINPLLSESSPFFTQIKTKSVEEQELQSYIAGVRKQIKDAVWKQELILQYNYMPLQSIKEKIELEKQTYLNKMTQFKDQYKKMFQNDEFTQELQNLRSFNLKLKDKMKHYELQIEENNVKNAIVKADANQKRERLKDLVRANMDLSKNYLTKFGVTNKEDIIRLVKAKSQIKFQKISSTHSNNLTQTKSTFLQRSSSAKSLKLTLRKSLFQECLDKLITDIKLKNSSSDIQSGIYLEIMDRKKNQYTNAGKMSHRSNISNTLHQRYAPKIHKRDNKHFEENDFEMDWDTFKELNWKQMVGIMLVKDPNCQKLKSVFSKFDFGRFS